MSRPPLDLYAEVTTATGRVYRWGSEARPSERPRALRFSTKLAHGFDRCSLTLPRRLDLDWPDLGLYNTLRIIADDGTVVWEGYISATPFSSDGGGTVHVQAVGFMAHAKDRKFSEHYINRDLGAWGEITRRRRAANLTDGRSIHAASVHPDQETGLPSLSLTLQAPWAKAICEAQFDAGPGAKAGGVYYDFEAQNLDGTFTARIGASNNADVDSQATDNLLPAAAGSGFYQPATPGRYLTLGLFKDAANAGATQHNIDFRKLAVVGPHGLTRYGDGPGGLTVSDMIRDSASRTCPLFDLSGVKDTTYPVPHAIAERIYPYDFWVHLNRYHLWLLAVWEGPTLHYEPFDLTDYDWEVRTDEPGTTWDPQGDTTDDLAAGIALRYFDVDLGAWNEITPETNPELAADDSNPAVQHSRDAWADEELSHPTTRDGAVHIARAVLADRNAAKAPGTIRVRGHIRDRAGHWRQPWAPRAGEAASITSHPSDRHRLVHETEYDHDSKEITIAVDGPPRTIDAVHDRLATELEAIGARR